MKLKTFFFSILFLILALPLLMSCETPNSDEEIYEIEPNGVDKDIERPGTQGKP